MNASLLTIGRRLSLALLLLGVGCQTPPQGAGQGGTVTVAIRPAFGTQATTGDVDHYEIGLIDTGTGNVVFRKTNVAASLSAITFSNVPPGTYRAFAEAFASPGDSYNITDGKSGMSTAPVTVVETGNSATLNLTINLKLIDAGPLAPGDGQNAAQTHGFTTTKNAITSEWVWIPRFRAYTLLQPANCGDHSRFSVTDNARPVGYWTGSRPKSGTPGTDWHDVDFGGFYVGKYEASHEDATSSVAGSATELAVQANVPPWTGITWTDARLRCRTYHPRGDLINDREWTSLAVWAQIHDRQIHGNTNGSSFNDVENPGTTFGANADPTAGGSGRARTGAGGLNTAHDGTGTGVHDLKGNVGEWTGSLSSGPSNWLIDDIPTTASLPGTSDRITSFWTTPRLIQVGLPDFLNGTGVPEYGHDGMVIPGGPGRQVVRGGNYSIMNSSAGIWHIDASHLPTASQPYIGFRPVLRF